MTVARTITAALIIIITWNIAEAQSGLARVSMSVPKAIFLALAAPSPEVEVVSGVPTEGALRVRVKPSVVGKSVRVSLVARSNTPYAVLARLATSSNSQLTVRPEGAEPYSGRGEITPDALDVRFEAASVVSRLADIPIIEGSRISKRGDQTTPNNAIVLTFYIDMREEPVGGAELILQMAPNP